MNIPGDSTSSFKRHRSKSFEPPERNVRAKLSLDLSSSNPQPATFLMGAMANELDNIAQMFLSDASTSSSNRLGMNISENFDPIYERLIFFTKEVNRRPGVPPQSHRRRHHRRHHNLHRIITTGL